jgi:hypothetical protein
MSANYRRMFKPDEAIETIDDTITDWKLKTQQKQGLSNFSIFSHTSSLAHDVPNADASINPSKKW